MTARSFCLAIAALLPFMMTTVSAAQQTSDGIQELEEVRVHGKRIVDQIAAAEDRFFPLFNKLNKNHEYDIKCNDVRLNPESMIMSRICIPEFFSHYVPPPSISAGTCSGASYNDSVGTCVGGGYEPPSAAFIIMARSVDLEKNMRKTIDSDPRLKQMADHLGGLYYEMRSVQDRFQAIKAANRKPVVPYKGPRSL